MPKKHQKSYLTRYQNHGTSSTQSTAASGSTLGSSSPSGESVNERLDQLRREQAPRPTVEKWNDVATLATAHTLPPHLRQILSLPEAAPVRPRRGWLAGQYRLAGRRFAGPPPPSSWLQNSVHAPAGARARARRELRTRLRDKAQDRAASNKRRQRPFRISLLAQLGDCPHPLPDPRSLKHQALKGLAQNWDWLADYEQNNLAAIPVHLKSCLLSYLSVFGPDLDINLASIRTLFWDSHELPDATGTTGLTLLDMSGLLSDDLTLAQLTRFFATKTLKPTTRESGHDLPLHTLSIREVTDDSQLVGEPRGEDTIDSWEDADEPVNHSIPQSLDEPKFSSIVRLSLANAGHEASWSQLLNLSVHLSKITHLSLAYWPIPSLTPNSRTAFVQHRHGEVSLGGSHIYSVLDEDWYEAANILRRLSKNTFSLRWFDLEGCAEWLPALAWQPNDTTADRWVDRTFHRGRTALQTTSAQAAFGAEVSSPASIGPDWRVSWSQISYVNVAQGSIPGDVKLLRNLPAGRIGTDLLLYLKWRDEMDEPVPWLEVDAQSIPEWLENEKVARGVASELRLRAVREKRPYCVFDHGWSVPVVPRREFVENAGQ